MIENTVTYIANACLMLNLEEKKILIDPLSTPGNEIYLDTEQVCVRPCLLIQQFMIKWICCW
jgi:L-ascorbate metabolism protein UlaG (beta-lactamase superfamily)